MFTVLAALALFLANVLAPGPSFVLVISNAMAHGRRSGRLIALGLATADFLFALAAMLGLAAVINEHPNVLKAVTLLGGLWFIYGGLRLVLKGKAKSLPAEAASTAGELPGRMAYRLGLVAGAVNPQAIIFFSALFVAVLGSRPGVGLLVGLVLGVFAISAGACALVQVLTRAPVKSSFQKHRRKVEAWAGAAMAGFGVKLAAPAAVFLARAI